jgi:hypothetical protein
MHGVPEQDTLGAEQLSWFLNDLARVNRTNTPWVIVAWHAPSVRAPCCPALPGGLPGCSCMHVLCLHTADSLELLRSLWGCAEQSSS